MHNEGNPGLPCKTNQKQSGFLETFSESLFRLFIGAAVDKKRKTVHIIHRVFHNFGVSRLFEAGFMWKKEQMMNKAGKKCERKCIKDAGKAD